MATKKKQRTSYAGTQIQKIEFPNIEVATSLLSSTDTSISGTVSAFNNFISVVEQEISKEPNSLNINLINSELTGLKIQVAELEAIKPSIKKVSEFIKDDIGFILTVTESKGRMNNIESQTTSLQKRVEFLEDKASKTKDRSIAVLAIVISIISVIVTVAIALFN